MIDPDPIGQLTGAPNPELARRFIDFVLSREGQALWQFPVTSSGLGPTDFELRRLPIRRSMYRDDFVRFVDKVDPWTIATPVAAPNRAMRAFIAPLFRAMALDQAEALQDAWRAITSHPGYPQNAEGLVTASSVSDPELSRLLAEFDSFPIIPGPVIPGEGASSFDLGNVDELAAVKAGWLRRGWAEEGLWPVEADPTEVLRRIARRHFRSVYEAIVAAQRPAG